MKKLIPQPVKNIYHLLQAILANVYYGFPSRKIKVIGITGTNGKTTTVQMVGKILEEAGKKFAMASTINFRIGGKEWVNKTKFTTLSAFAVQKFIKQAVDAKCEYLVLETSSHSLDQYRVWGVKYQTAVITNVTREHLDYHKTMEDYAEAKEKLFEMVSENSGTTIVNLDMERAEDYLKYPAKKKYGYTAKQDQEPGIKDQEAQTVKAEEIRLDIQGTRYKIQDTEFGLYLPGQFNVENALAATCVGLSENIGPETISRALGKIKNVPGRFEFVPNSRNLNIIVDYAVTPDSLEKLYGLVGEININKNEVVSVFGSCGDRDRGKRPIMGEIVSRHADCIILTNEDPYTEDPQRIIDEVADGIKNKVENQSFWKIMDRREAIRKALSLAKAGDFVIVTGKGAEETMMVGKDMVPWNDREVIEEELQKLE